MTTEQIRRTRKFCVRTIRGLDFVDSTGVRVRDFQFMENGFAVAIADFDNGTVRRFEFADRVESDAREWLQWLKDCQL